MAIPLKREIAAAVDDGVSRAGTRDGSYDGPRELAQDATQTTWDVGQGGFAGLESKHVELSDQDVNNVALKWPPRDDFEAYRLMDFFMRGEVVSGAAQGFGLDVELSWRRSNESDWNGSLPLGTVKVGRQGFSSFTFTSYQYDGATEVPFFRRFQGMLLEPNTSLRIRPYLRNAQQGTTYDYSIRIRALSSPFRNQIPR